MQSSLTDSEGLITRAATHPCHRSSQRGIPHRVTRDVTICVACHQVAVKAPVSGLVEEVLVEEGGKVIEGALLVKIQT